MAGIELSEDLRLARRTLEGQDGYELLEDFSWDIVRNMWVLKFRLTNGIASAFVPDCTDWYLTVSPTYPWGRIDIYPSSENGIVYTFPHQSHNELVAGAKWRTGNICVSTSVGLWGKKYFNSEPYAAKSRLAWHVARCKDWLAAAAADILAVKGDPFEMPSFKKTGGQLFAFNEDNDTFDQWRIAGINYGTFFAKEVFSAQPIYPIIRFKCADKEIQYKWGAMISRSKAVEISNLWVMFERIPVISPWQMPATWGQLFEVAREQGLDLRAILEKNLFKGGKVAHRFLLVGFPVPENVGEEPCRTFWLAIALPVAVVLPGFRKGSPSLKAMQFKLMFHDDVTVTWSDTENWNKTELTVRGKVSDSITDLKFVIIGAGAIGSHLSELLLRLGCDHLTLIDDDLLEMGNLSRHTLNMNMARSGKAAALTDRLNSIFPSAAVTAISKSLDHRFDEGALVKLVETNDVFIDATGDDSVIRFISKLLAGTRSKFISVSTGFAAKRLFCYMADAGQMQIEQDFLKCITPWLEQDAHENPDPHFPREGIGCWHPVFPARIDDIWMLLSTIIKKIERFLEGNIHSEFVVVEKQIDDQGSIKGINIIDR